MRHLEARHVLYAMRSGSSCPVVVETSEGCFVTKLRGAAQGTSALVAEVIAAELAEQLDLPVPERALIDLQPNFRSEDRNTELLDLLDNSVGLNLGFRLLDGAQAIAAADAQLIDPVFGATTLWFDGLIMNLDRHAMNPNILSWNGGVWLIDHGAALPFQHWWPAVSEDSPKEQLFQHDHLFAAQRSLLAQLDESLAERLDRGVLEHAVSAVPDEMLNCAPFNLSAMRTRAAYAAFLWKRLKGPRVFL